MNEIEEGERRNTGWEGDSLQRGLIFGALSLFDSMRIQISIF